MSSDSSAFLLLVEDSHVLSTLLVKWIGGKFPKKYLANVSTLRDARDFVESCKVDFYLVDLNLPDGNGMDSSARCAPAPRTPGSS